MRATTWHLVVLLCLPAAAGAGDVWRGVDLSYVNELEDCGAEYRHGDATKDPFRIMADAGANIVRLRLWVAPDWTRYSTFDDVRKSLARAKAAGMRTLLDLHYSDDWAHPGKQLRPAGWPPADDTDGLSGALAEYTTDTLLALEADGLLPDVVAVGNETNTDMLIDEEVDEKADVNWARNVRLLNAGIRAVRQLDVEPERRPQVMLHIAQPENVRVWFDDGIYAGLDDFDIIGVSYYPKWSSTPFSEIREKISEFRSRFGSDVVVVETAYPWTLDGKDAAGNLLGDDSLVDGYPATPDGQRRFLIDLQSEVVAGGGLGIVYWEPAWVSSSCQTRWGQGSHWENAALFDFENRLLPGAAFLRAAESDEISD
ncbi:MAG: glycosyl hydrolase 53 family protein [Woeseiaceae bacterium]|nr:glycosyl hydrolase 53 family protein [Woeseiaceae bacterium]